MHGAGRVNQKLNLTSLHFFTILKVCIETIENSKHHLIKINKADIGIFKAMGK